MDADKPSPNAILEREVERALDKVRGLLTPEQLEVARARMIAALADEPDVMALARAVQPRAVNLESGDEVRADAPPAGPAAADATRKPRGR